MGLTNFPNGISSFGMPVIGMGEETMTTGNVFFVDSGSAHASDGGPATSPDTPAATIDACIAKCTANNGDIIFVMPGHAENIAATDIAMDVAGVWVRGLGWGADRPTLTFTATGSTIAMSAASTRISNILCVPGIAAVAAAFTVTAADCIIENSETREAAVYEFTSLISATAAATRMIVRNNRLLSLNATGATAGIMVTGCDGIQIYGNEVSGHFADGCAMDNVTAGSVDEVLLAVIRNNIFRNFADTALVIDMDDNATGILAYNLYGTGQADEAGFDSGNMFSYESYLSDSVDESGKIMPTTVLST